jgi:hypothetical protein
VVSAVPGRLRLKLSGERRSPEAMERLREMLEGRPEVAGIDVRPRTGSLLIHHDPESAAVGEVLDALAETGLFVEHEPAQTEGRTGPARLSEAAGRVDREVRRATKGTDLRLLVPLTFGALSARRALRDAPNLEGAPWYVLAWYAFDSFLKLNPSGAGGAAVEHGGESAEAGARPSA